jgi:hypothetical protein
MDEAFVSELGATSLPNYATLAKFMGDQWPIADHAAEWDVGRACRFRKQCARGASPAR